MTAAPVGFQCPECVADGAKVTERAQRAISQDRPWVSWGIIAFCAAVFLLQFALGSDRVINYFGMWPVAIAADGEWYRLLTSVFLHAGILHIAFNMYVLLVLGPPLERALGHVRFLVLFLLAGLGGSVASFVFSAPTTISVGASGAIFGIMGALVVAGRRLRWDITQVVVLIGINIAIGFVFGSGIDWRAHLGGLVTGAAVAALMVLPAHDVRRRYVEIGGVLVVGAVLVAAAVLRADQLALPG